MRARSKADFGEAALQRERAQRIALGLLRQGLCRAERGESTHHPRQRHECRVDEAMNRAAAIAAACQRDGDRVAREHAEGIQLRGAQAVALLTAEIEQRDQRALALHAQPELGSGERCAAGVRSPNRV